MRVTASLTCDGVRLGHQPRQTSADGVAVPVGGAGGAGAAGTGVAGVGLGALELGGGVRHEALGALAEWPAFLAMETNHIKAKSNNMLYLRNTHGVATARVGVTWIRDDAALGRCWVGDETFRTFAGGFPLLGNAHGARSTGVGITGVSSRCGGVIRGEGSRLGRGGLPGASVGAAVEAAEAPVRAVQVRDAHRPAGGVTAPALVSSEGRGRGAGARGGRGLTDATSVGTRVTRKVGEPFMIHQGPLVLLLFKRVRCVNQR